MRDTISYISINFLWIPSQVGILQNDKVDLLTKSIIFFASPIKYIIPTSEILNGYQLSAQKQKYAGTQKI